MIADQTDILIFFVVVFGLAGIAIGWVLIDILQKIRDALNLANLRESERRSWDRKGHQRL